MRSLAIVALAVVAMTCTAGIASAGANGCEPSFFRVSDEVISDRSIGVERQINGAVIGCAGDLGTISGKEQEQLKGLLRQVLVEEGYNLIAKVRSKEFRAELARRINKLLGRHVASDVFLFNVSFSE